ncbi:hypothetical protein SAMN05444392_11029 [Seinonella peptonophila]|uniref:Uncharacterized protein n=1 Tax=Seinonella peptonophila TaxID=112248 RepID=A0A1M4ZNY0_9BACL|nr:hypothetical protein SAMN05444392_11029 [Seinonella peptonophila]
MHRITEPNTLSGQTTIRFYQEGEYRRGFQLGHFLGNGFELLPPTEVVDSCEHQTNVQLS